MKKIIAYLNYILSFYTHPKEHQYNYRLHLYHEYLNIKNQLIK